MTKDSNDRGVSAADAGTPPICECGCGEPTIWQKNAQLLAGGRWHCRATQRERDRRRNATPRGRAYWSWHEARRRCTDPTHRDWAYYGGRGIRMCAEWLDDFEAFYAHLGGRPKDRTLDRIDNDRGYEPGNVRWATPKQQRANQRPRGAT